MNEDIKHMRFLISRVRNLYIKFHINNDKTCEEMYESARQELQEFENQNSHLIQKDSPSLHVGIQLNAQYTNNHLTPMLSIDHTYNIDILHKKIQKMLSEYSYISMQEKIDGVSLSLQYINNYLDCALLRGDGKGGENVIVLTQYIKCIPQELLHGLSGNYEIRGELYLANDLQNEHIRTKLSGMIRRHVVEDFNIKFIAYDVIHSTLTNYDDIQTFLIKNQFKTVTKHVNLYDIQNLNNIVNTFINTQFDYETDGIVFKGNNINRSYTHRYAKNAFTYKYTREATLATVNNITWNMSRKHELIPTIHIEPIMIDNMRITKLSGHNYNYLQTKQININAKISICRIGNTAPQLVNVIESQNSYILKTCPYCNLNIDFTAIHAVCNNVNCTQHKHVFIHYFFETMNINGFSENIINKLINKYGYDLMNILRNIKTINWIENENDKKVHNKILNKNMSMIDIMICMGWPNISRSVINKYYINNAIKHDDISRSVLSKCHINNSIKYDDTLTSQRLYELYTTNYDLLHEIYNIFN